MAYMSETEIQDTQYPVLISIMSDQVETLDPACTYCGEEPSVSVLSYTTDCGTERETHFRDLCMTCVVPVLDSVAYLDESMPITLEVARVATERPF
jgi:hypothetical protein